MFKLLNYKTMVTAGVTYFMKVRVKERLEGDGNCLFVRALKKLEGNVLLKAYKSADCDDSIENF
ncbi:uncharacterized protein LOC142355705 isoform X2 [Convolutriloba macropyga]